MGDASVEAGAAWRRYNHCIGISDWLFHKSMAGVAGMGLQPDAG